MDQLEPDIVLVLGDRVEPLAAAIAASYMGMPVAHIHGGDVTRGGMDEYARHAITKMSHIHFAATDKSAERIIKMGEETKHVHVVGAPGIDSIRMIQTSTRDEICRRYSLNEKLPYIIVVQHSVSTDPDLASKEMTETMEAVHDVGLQALLLYPNSDPGGISIIEIVKHYLPKGLLRIHESIPHDDYLSLLKYASAIVGNSSSGIIEAPYFGTPAVNIGTRQEGREREDNVIDSSPRRESIVSAIKRALEDEQFIEHSKNGRNVYGDGAAGTRIANILAEIIITPELLRKKLTF